MRLIGDIEDVVGFGLAGVRGSVCETREAVIASVEDFRRNPDVVLILFSSRTARLAPDVVEKAMASPGFPVAVVLPGEAATQDETDRGATT